MAEDRSADWRVPVPGPETVTANLGGAYWSVQRHSWSGLRPDLPAEVAALVAPPVVVGATPLRAARPGVRPRPGRERGSPSAG
jgi:hypothetical protein